MEGGLKEFCREYKIYTQGQWSSGVKFQRGPKPCRPCDHGNRQLPRARIPTIECNNKNLESATGRLIEE